MTRPADGGTGDASSPAITIGSANFPENQLLAEMYAQALEAKDVTVTRKFNIGARELYLKALKDGSIDMIPEYNGELPGGAVAQRRRSPEGVTTTDQVNQALMKVLPKGLKILESSPAEDKDTLTVTSDDREQVQPQVDRGPQAGGGKLAIGAGPEFKTRYQGARRPGQVVYGLTFKEFKPLDPGGPLTKAALKKGQIQVANIFSTDSAIATDNLVVLEDTKNLFLAQNITPVHRRRPRSRATWSPRSTRCLRR